MIQVNKKKLTRKNLSIIITASVLALLIAAYVIISAVISAMSGSPNNPKPPEVMEEIGEAVSGGSTLAYPSFKNSEIEGIVVDSHNGRFAMYRSDEENYFFFCYEDANGDMQIYYPDIVGAENQFDYTDLYATESETGLNIYKLTYLLTSVTTLTFDQRIELSSDSEERQKQLNRYGLSDGDKETLVVLRTDGEGNKIKYNIEIGDNLLAGAGYYYRVDDRDYVYTCNTDTFKYALGGFEAFLHSRVVAEGLAVDNAFEPYLTTDYKQWKNTLVSYDKDSEIQELVKANSKVTVTASALAPVYDEEDLEDKTESNGYYSVKTSKMSFDLASYELLSRYDRLVSTLVGRPLGIYSSDPLLATVISDTLEVEFGEGDTVSYVYTVTAVESILCESGEYDTQGACASDYSDAEMIRVTYNYSVGGAAGNTVPRHAVIDLSDGSIAEADRERLAAAKIGEAQNISFTVSYDKNTTESRNVKYVISEIALIYNVGEDGEMLPAETVGETSIVTYRHYFMVGDTVVGEQDSTTVDMSKLAEGNYLKIKNVLMGKSAGRLEPVTAFEDVTYLQSLMDFVTYKIESVDYYVTSEMITSFEFVNASVRDSFYGESLYINTLPSANSYRNYALNSSACEMVVRLLGGINADGNTNNSYGLMGTETVAVGLTPDVMYKYGLYANTVYFELPRGIQVESTGNSDDLDDYTYLDTLGFTIYISDYNEEDGCRYAASDMYGVVVKIVDKGFDYLDYSFVEFWARRSLMMVDFKDIEEVTLDLYMDDVYGSYVFDTVCDTIWISGGEHYSEPVDGGTEYDFLTVNVSSNGQSSGNKLVEYLTASGADYINMADVYNKVAEEKTGVEQWLSIGNDTMGASYFKELLFVLYNIHYTGSLTAEEQAEGKKTEKIMSISFTVDGSAKDTYTYDFYRIDDRRVMVSLYNPGYENEVSDFYISTFAFKKIISNFDRLMNGEQILPDLGYDS